jgi:hypothetical protein
MRCQACGVDVGGAGEEEAGRAFVEDEDEWESVSSRQQRLLDEVRGMQALSVRQPWGWLILHGKDHENREWKQSNPGRHFRGEFLIHVGSGMTKHEYAEAIDAAEQISQRTGVLVDVPPIEKLLRGGIIGRARIVNWVDEPRSDWGFTSGFEIADPEPLPFIPCPGALGFFEPNLPSAHERWVENYFPKPKEKGWRRTANVQAEAERLKQHIATHGRAR